ncbi:MAG: hypothetical protein LBC73_11130 [Oscillospiraceae bacterium]|jgi:hypothetical protein|nr:hypothetical protein [Oscillospiraceae bacterium]
MQAYEFYTTPENGVITIPEQFRRRITAGVKVILLQQNMSDSKNDAYVSHKSDLLLSPTMSTVGWSFNREEANER